MSKIVVTLMADDRPGLVNAVSELVVSHGGNWLESKMADLGGVFTGLILIDVPDANKAALSAALAAFGQDDIAVSLRDAREQPGAQGDEFRLSIEGADHPGIVNEITDRLQAHAINIAEMETDHQPAAMSGQPMFSASILAILPADADKAALEAELEQAAEELMVDISFR